ncbi:hypothetical protein BOX15_Mlig031152g1, partial [Macrostomum lignano]
TIEEKSERSTTLAPAASAIRAEVNSPRREELERKLVGVRQYTPNTELSTPRWNPDISIYCHACRELVSVREIVQHKRYHREMRHFGLANVANLTLEQLTAARRRKVQQLEERLGGCSAVRATDLERVNQRYAFLRAHLFEENRGRLVLASRPAEQIPANDVESRGLRCSVPFVLGAGAASFHNARFGRRPRARAAYQDWLGGDPAKCFVGLYAGRYGDTAAKLASEEMHHFLLCELARFDPGTRCTCAFNMAAAPNDKPEAAPEIHRPSTGGTSARQRERLHWTSANLVHSVLRTCAERLDEFALAYARSRTPDLRWYDDNNENENDDKGDVVEDDDSNVDGWADKVAAAFAKALEYTDGLLKRGQSDYAAVRWSGASVGAVLVRAADELEGGAGDGEGAGRRRLGWLHAAACGDVQLILVRNNQPHGLSSPAPNRGIGYHGDPEMKRRLSCRPDCRCVPIDSECQAVVMATAGVTGVLNPAEICQLVATHLPVNRVRVASSLEDSERRRLFGETDTRASSSSRSATPSTSSSFEAAAADAVSEADRPGSSSGSFDHDVDESRRSSVTATTEWDLGGEGRTEAEGEGEVDGLEVSLAEEVARRLAQAAVLAGSQEDLATAVLLLPAAFQTDWRPPRPL